MYRLDAGYFWYNTINYKSAKLSVQAKHIVAGITNEYISVLSHNRARVEVLSGGAG